MKSIIRTCVIALSLLAGLKLSAQEKLTIDKVYSVTLRNSGSIMEGEQVKGYYFFYQSDKIDRKTNEYTLQIVDQNLNKVKDIKFQDSKNLLLLESAYNGNAIIFMFHDKEQKLLDFRVYGTDGAKKANYSKEITKRTEQWLAMYRGQSLSDDNENHNIYDIKNRGFIAVIPVKDGGHYSYEVEFYHSTKRKQWNYTPSDEEKWANAQYLGTNDSLVFIEVLKKQRLMSGKVQTWLLGLNIANGKKAFEIETEAGANKMLPMNVSALNGKETFMLMGPYYESDDRVLQDESQGIAVWEMDNTGKIKKEKYNSWSKDIGRYLKTDSKGRVEDLGYVYFHEILQTSDGKIFAIGEGYKKQASAAGIATNILAMASGSSSSGMGMAKLKITDMVLMQFDAENYSIKDARIYEKNNNNVEMPAGSTYMSPHTMALLAKSFGSFDYNYTQPGKNNNGFVTTYSDYIKDKDYKGLTFNSISYYDGNITTDKINLKSSSSSLRVLPAKEGYVMIIEYYRKDKKLEVRLEKLN